MKKEKNRKIKKKTYLKIISINLKINKLNKQ